MKKKNLNQKLLFENFTVYEFSKLHFVNGGAEIDSVTKAPTPSTPPNIDVPTPIMLNPSNTVGGLTVSSIPCISAATDVTYTIYTTTP